MDQTSNWLYAAGFEMNWSLNPSVAVFFLPQISPIISFCADALIQAIHTDIETGRRLLDEEPYSLSSSQ